MQEGPFDILATVSALLQPSSTLQTDCKSISSVRADLHLNLGSEELFQAAASQHYASRVVQVLSIAYSLAPHLSR